MNRARTIRGTIDGWHRCDDGFETNVHVDGAALQNVNVTVDDGIVTVQARHDTLEMFRSFAMPEEAVTGWVTARLHDDRLTIRVDSGRHGAPRRIAIEEK